jgi:hypothetical protein
MYAWLFKGIFTYEDLLKIWRKGLRNKNWVKLTYLEKGLFRCSLSLAKLKGRIINLNLVACIGGIALKLLALTKMHVIQVGWVKAQAWLHSPMLKWCPSLKEWLKDQNYIFYLGMMELFGQR